MKPRSIAALALVLASSCTGTVGLTVDALTDYVADQEFAAVRTELSTSPFTTASVSGTPVQLTVSRSLRFLSGARVAEYHDLAAGTYWVRVSLLSGAGAVVAHRITQVVVSQTFSMTSVLTRSCGETRCPPDGAPALLACNGGTCVDPRCTPETPAFCGAGECAVDRDCVTAATGECARAVCQGGACLFGAEDALCAFGQHCNARLTCEANDLDAGPPDSSGPDAARPVDLGPGCPMHETACTDGMDEDCDALTDCADPDCGGAACNDGNGCTHGDACAGGACSGTAITCTSDGCADRACNGTATCTVTPHPGGSACADDGNSCTTDQCDGAGSCTHPALPGFSVCATDGNDCTYDLCDGGATCVHPNHDGLHGLGTAICCAGGFIDYAGDPNNCGACGIRCASGSCIAGECTCFGNAECIGAGYGAQATCFMSRCQCVCNADPAWRGQCGGECAGGAQCDQTVGLNHCFYP